MEKFRLAATAAFGIESVLKKELYSLGFENIKTENGRIFYDAPPEGIAKSNIWLRTADRVYMVMGTFKALSYTQLFDAVEEIEWEKIVPLEGRVVVNAKSVKSQLYSKSDIQSISKKAISKRLGEHYNVDWLPDRNPLYDVTISIYEDTVSVLLDTSGDALHKRGYRQQQNEAPLKETLASALVMLSDWDGRKKLIDPMCGSGTILIEAAMIARNIAPGLQRSFVSENWDIIPQEIWKKEKALAYSMIDRERRLDIEGYDKDPQAIKVSLANAKLAGVDEDIKFKLRKMEAFSTTAKEGTIIVNPPYGERMEDKPAVSALYRAMGEKFGGLRGFSKYVITSFEGFEKEYGEKSDSNRKLFNGRIKTYYYNFNKK